MSVRFSATIFEVRLLAFVSLFKVCKLLSQFESPGGRRTSPKYPSLFSTTGSFWGRFLLGNLTRLRVLSGPGDSVYILINKIGGVSRSQQSSILFDFVVFCCLLPA